MPTTTSPGLGDPAAALPGLERIAAASDSEYVAARLAHVQALLAEDAAALDEVATSFEQIGAALLGSEAAAAASALHQRATLRRAAAASARHATALLADCEGAQPFRAVPDQPGVDLTRREREIAELAARDLSSREIAEQLVLSARTVENHLQRGVREARCAGSPRAAGRPGASRPSRHDRDRPGAARRAARGRPPLRRPGTSCPSRPTSSTPTSTRRDLVATMRDLGLFGVTIAPEHGGLGLDLLTYIGVIEELAAGWMSLSGILNTHVDGGHAHRARTAPTSSGAAGCRVLATGEVRAALSLSEPDAGSDTGALRVPRRRDGDEYVINGTKGWVTNGERGRPRRARGAHRRRDHVLPRRQGARRRSPGASR